MKNRYLQKLTKDIKEVPWDYDPGLDGLKGWMVLVIIGRFVAIIAALISIPNMLEYYGYLDWLDTFMTLSIAVLVPIDVIASIVILVFIFKENILFRKIFVIYTIYTLALTLAAMIYLKVAYDTTYTNPIFTLIGSAIWITYLYKSKRVKNTFIYPYLDFIDEIKYDKGYHI